MAEEIKQSFFRSSLSRIVLFTIALGTLAVIAYIVGGKEQDQPQTPLVCADDDSSLVSPLFRHRMEDVALISMQRKPVMLSELAGQRFTVAIYCSYKCPCSDGYIDRYRDLRARFEQRGVAFIAINANADETIDGMVQYMQRRDYPLPVYRDDMTAAADLMNATVTPEAFVFDSSWTLRYHGRIDDDKSGLYVEDQSLRMALDTLLSGQQLRHKEKMSPGCGILREHPISSGT
ncbi:MAG: redoxin domain-containing protein [Bacteroidota bacterium]